MHLGSPGRGLGTSSDVIPREKPEHPHHEEELGDRGSSVSSGYLPRTPTRRAGESSMESPEITEEISLTRDLRAYPTVLPLYKYPPVGLRVLAVDDDPTCLKLLDTLLRKRQYHVTATSQARTAVQQLGDRIYDPIFILRFSIHCLSMGYIEPTEFASLGLLAITFVSMSSPDGNMRKLGYEALAKFKDALQRFRNNNMNCKKQHVAQLRLLVLYVQNGIEEQWQRIPSIISVFVAEASLVLLDPSHDNYSTISKFLINSPCVNMRAIPLFENLFWSSSVSFRNDRLWILRLLYVGLNVEDDAQMYIRNSIFEKIFGSYSSPLSDNDSQELIVQIIKKAVKLHKLAWNLVEQCGIILWLSSIVSSHCWNESEDRKNLYRNPSKDGKDAATQTASPAAGDKSDSDTKSNTAPKDNDAGGSPVKTESPAKA
ncbi:hypothetical protein F511_15643 [Dorcoceras hygrometricum]|uniref:URB1 C-terminal domain-containing protein n=1 Tax=Dorcoceras hygrometricum TaxID=472368 RepID=A0A2Z7BZG4_9LAMI|nr:hypothetical protein F511_15643 [Dorcoceras hygrometricum]